MRRRREPEWSDEAALHLTWARLRAHHVDLAGLGTPREVAERHRETGRGPETHGDFYYALSAGELRELAERRPGDPASARVLRQLDLAHEAGGEGAA